MIKERDLIRALKFYKVDVYSDNTSRETLTDFLRDQEKIVYQGQKRIVVIDKVDRESTVLKIAYSIQGLRDNIQECICSQFLVDLNREGKISDDELNRFGLAQPIDHDPFIIKMAPGTTIDNDKEFNEWYENNKYKIGTDITKVRAIPLWLKEQPTLAEDFTKIQEIAANYLIASDISLNEPLNYVIDIEGDGYNRRKRLRLIDLGSCLPIFESEDGDSRPRCPYCDSGKLVYIPFNLRDSRSIDTKDVELLEGKYGCSSKRCSRYYKDEEVASMVSDVTNKDFVIFSDYIRSQRPYIRVFEAIIGGFFVPDRVVTTLREYWDELKYTIGLDTKPSDSELRAMYDNYLSKLIGDMLIRNQEIFDVEVIDKYNEVRTLDDYAGDVLDILYDNGEISSIDNVTKRLVCMSYLKKLVSECDVPLSTYDLLLSSDLASFTNDLSKVIDSKSIKTLFDGLSIR